MLPLQETTAAASSNFFASPIFLFLLLILIMYFFMFAPQRKQQKQLDAFRKSLQAGSKVVTSGGIYGTVKDITTENGKEIVTDYVGTIDTGSVVLTSINTKAAAAGTQEALDAAIVGLQDGTIHVFDTATPGFITVDGQPLDESWKPGEATDGAFVAGTKIVYGGYFHESEYRSAPCFDAQIDGIKLLNVEF